MDGLTGLAAVVMLFGMPVALLGMYTFYGCASCAPRNGLPLCKGE